MKVMTARFGEIEIGDDKIIEMPDGIIGFPDRRFVMLSPDNNGSSSGCSPRKIRSWLS